jgi:2-amino-4-hydroxy-6-hydroxymethyldihydropteridine diphosphokinase
LGLGTNLGDRDRNLTAARTSLLPEVRPLRASSVYETPPWGVLDQPHFLNQALEAETDLPPLHLLAYLKDLEVELGRLPAERYGPRLIDLDILFYDDLVLDTPELTIPHPRISERAFVLAPLANLAPDLVHPLEKKTIVELLEACDRSGIVLHER